MRGANHKVKRNEREREEEKNNSQNALTEEMDAANKMANYHHVPISV